LRIAWAAADSTRPNLPEDPLSPSRTTTRAKPAAHYQVGPETVVRLSYAVFDAEGEQIEASDEPVEVIFGASGLLPAVERRLEGAVAGERRSLTLPARDAFGERDKRAILEVDRAEFPTDVAPGDRFELEDQAGHLLVMKVLDLDDERVVLDANHPLAGQRVRFELDVVDVRPARIEEIEQALERLEKAESPPERLLSPERLIRGLYRKKP
jgi:FKBP-type peptidyl-prolyl cis-trans isomerase SlyD